MNLIENVSATEAFATANRNKLRRYPSPNSGGDRLYPLATPGMSPSFRIEPSDTVFAIGSCFARNVEKALAKAGHRVLSTEIDLGEIGASLDDANNFFNKYTIQSVLNDVRWAVDRKTFPGADSIYRLGSERHADLQLGMARIDFPMPEILAFKERYLDSMAQVMEADVIILTLGYVETWFDRKLGIYLNAAPPRNLAIEYPERFEFRVLSYQDIIDGLEEFYALLLEHRTKPMKFLVTVSPVPLHVTFRDMDVLVANSYSKSVQRAALEQFVIGKTGVDYFPSFEFVTLSDPSETWSKSDYRHVTQGVVNRIMSFVLTNYVADQAGNLASQDGEMTSGALLTVLAKLQEADENQTIVESTAKYRALVDRDAELLLIESVALRKLRRNKDAWIALSKAVELVPGRPVPLERLILLSGMLGREADVARLLETHAERFPRRVDFRNNIGGQQPLSALRVKNP